MNMYRKEIRDDKTLIEVLYSVARYTKFEKDSDVYDVMWSLDAILSYLDPEKKFEYGGHEDFIPLYNSLKEFNSLHKVKANNSYKEYESLFRRCKAILFYVNKIKNLGLNLEKGKSMD